MTERPRMRSTRTHIEEWRDSVPVGTEATIAEIAAYASQEYRTPSGQEYPATGAVAARLFPASPLAGVIHGLSAIPPEGGKPARVRKTSEGKPESIDYHKMYARSVRGSLEYIRTTSGANWADVRAEIAAYLEEHPA